MLTELTMDDLSAFINLALEAQGWCEMGVVSPEANYELRFEVSEKPWDGRTFVTLWRHAAEPMWRQDRPWFLRGRKEKDLEVRWFHGVDGLERWGLEA